MAYGASRGDPKASGPRGPAEALFRGKVNGNMGKSSFDVAWLRAGALVLTLMALPSVAGAQPAKKAPEKAQAPAAQTQKGAQPAAAATPAAQQSAWVKLCEKVTATNRDKEGKEEKKDLNICLTHHERLDGNTGMVLVSAALRQVEGQEKQHFMVMVPLGMLLQPGMRATVYPKDMWEKIQKNEKVDDSNLKQVKLAYSLCHPAGCTAEIDATPELLNDLKTGGGMVVFVINAAGVALPFPVPLNGFATSYAGAPVDTQKYSEARRALMQQIAARQQQLIEEQKKQQEAAAAAKGTPPAQKK
jgi:invasion protein IalB